MQKCKVENCSNQGRLSKNGKRYFILGYCNKHYIRVRKYNSVNGIERPPRGALVKFFNEKIQIETDECIIWPYSKFKQGYGTIRINNKDQKVHRLALAYRSDQPKGDKKFALHKPLICHNRACFNYRHLYWGNIQDNANDREKDGELLLGEKNGNCKLTSESVKDIRRSTKRRSILAKEYNISVSSVRLIQLHKSWAWL
jgi:hypothetical protein